MVEHAKQLIHEIQQIKTQSVAEVGKGRRVWPRSIKERTEQLDKMGVPVKAVAAETGIPYETLILWRYSRRRAAAERAEFDTNTSKVKFHELKVSPKEGLSQVVGRASSVSKSISQSGSVTVPGFEMPRQLPAPAGGLRLTTPNGFIVEGLEATTAAWLIGALTLGGRDDN